MPPQRTDVTPAQFKAALSRAYETVHGEAPSAATLEILSAHVAHETASGAKMYNYNFGGIKGRSPAGLTARLRTHEYFGGKKVNLRDGFRAYRSLDEGAVDYMALMSTRFGEAMDQAKGGDVDGFSHALKNKRYYTAPVEMYARAMRGHMGESIARQAAAFGHARGHELAHAVAGGAKPIEIDALPTMDIVRLFADVGAHAATIAAPADDEGLKPGDERPFS